MSTTIWVIMTLVIGVIALLSILSNLVTRTPSAMRELAAQYSPVDPQPGAKRGGARGAIDWSPLADVEPDPRRPTRQRPRGKIIDLRWAIDEDALHLAQYRGVIGGGASASVPWAAMRLKHTDAGHMGGFAAITIHGGFTLVLPSAVVSDEMQFLRSAGAGGLESPADDAPIPIDAPPENG